MNNQIKVVIVDDETVSIDGHELVEKDALHAVLRAAMQKDPGVILVIEPTKSDYYKGTGKVIYASRYVGLPIENLRFATENGEVLSLDELRERHPTPPV